MNKFDSLMSLNQTFATIEREQNNICYWLEVGIMTGTEYNKAQSEIDLDTAALLDECDRHDTEHGLTDGRTAWAILTCD